MYGQNKQYAFYLQEKCMAVIRILAHDMRSPNWLTYISKDYYTYTKHYISIYYKR